MASISQEETAFVSSIDARLSNTTFDRGSISADVEETLKATLLLFIPANTNAAVAAVTRKTAERRVFFAASSAHGAFYLVRARNLSLAIWWINSTTATRRSTPSRSSIAPKAVCNSRSRAA